jgi:hypothetical protein
MLAASRKAGDDLFAFAKISRCNARWRALLVAELRMRLLNGSDR